MTTTTSAGQGGSGHDSEETDQPEFYTANLLECPICLSCLTGVIQQCSYGHVICVTCYNHLDQKDCPTCKTRYPALSIRNRAVEHIIQQAQLLGLVERPEPVVNRTTVTVRPQEPPSRFVYRPRRTATFDPRPVRHGVTCDGPQCTMNGVEYISGVRYKCAECSPSFDLCDRCAKDGVHGYHVLIRIGKPEIAPGVERKVAKFQEWRRVNEPHLVPPPSRRVATLPPSSRPSSPPVTNPTVPEPAPLQPNGFFLRALNFFQNILGITEVPNDNLPAGALANPGPNQRQIGLADFNFNEGNDAVDEGW